MTINHTENNGCCIISKDIGLQYAQQQFALYTLHNKYTTHYTSTFADYSVQHQGS